jgi:hypothetical protein
MTDFNDLSLPERVRRIATYPLAVQVLIVREAIAQIHREKWPNQHTLEDLSEKQLELLFKLCSGVNISAWAIQVLSINVSPNQYYSLMNAADMGLVKNALATRLWEKCIGLPAYDQHQVGEIVHTLRYFMERNHEDGPNTAAPADYAPSYNEALQNRRYESALFVGAFSLVSIMGIQGIKKWMLGDCPVTIVDIAGKLSKYAAECWEMPFVYKSALDMRMPESFDLILTNCLTRLLTNPSTSASGTPILRALFFDQCFTTLRSGGQLVLVEHFLNQADSRSYVAQHVKQAGFKKFDILPVHHLDIREDALRFVRTGRIGQIDFMHPDSMYLLIAEK